VAEAIPRCESILEQTVGDQRAEATILCALSHLDAMAGDFERARSRYSKARATLEGLGGRVLAASTSLDSGPVELLAGDLAAAERELLHDYEVLEAMGERYFISTTAALLAEALYRQDRLEESERFTVASQELADPEDLTSQHLWRSVRGKVLARRSRTDEAETLLREAVELTRRSDDPDARGSALLDLAEAMVLIGRDAEAEEAATEAALLFEGKGNVVSARHARGFQRRGARA
jgi:tetratricopeptide (TPR) repeat protein